MNWVPAISDISVAVSAIVVAVVALLGLRAWRAQMVGRAKYDAARRMVLAAIRVEFLFAEARLQWQHSSSKEGCVQSLSSTRRESGLLEWWHRYHGWFRKLVDQLAELREATWECDVVLDPDAMAHLAEHSASLADAYKRLAAAASEYYQQCLRECREDTFVPQPERMTELKSMVFGNIDDGFSLNVEQDVGCIQRVAQRYLR